ncbi:PH domain-containing protein [Microbacterium sp. GXF7504]
MLLVLWAVYVGLYASHVATDATGVTVQNYLRRTRIGWGAVTDVAMRYQLVITTADGRRITCYGGPATGRPARAVRRGEDAGSAASGDIVDAWETARRDAGADTAVTRSWDVPALVALLVLVAGALVALLIVNA